jgi:hypothetical protein
VCLVASINPVGSNAASAGYLNDQTVFFRSPDRNASNVSLAHGLAPSCRTRSCITFHHRSRFTGYKVEGRTSTFGYLTGDSEGQTADGGTTNRPCIAIRNDATLDHWFEVTINGHHAKLLDCDWGPAEWTGRSIDVTGRGDETLGFSPSSFPTGAWGIARELR